jgi:hypothetical protein
MSSVADRGEWMGMAVCTRASGAPRNIFRRLGVGLAAATLLGLCVGGCATAPQAPAAYASARGPTVAFDSIDGPPETIFQQLVQDLSDEAAARQMAVVSRESPAQYRVRGYLAALVSKQRTTVISWVWDVYDADQQRALRISGEEPANRSGRGTWAAADDQVLRRIAKAGMDRLAAFLGAPAAEPGSPPASPDSRGPNVATNDPAMGDVASPAVAYSANAR